ncbi:murein L,D-transpeptidase catalytic domain family protein [Flavitalea sp. BT771]|uniref:murein L,D-transpeptidase catalytic domain family protein n=1 Tax=Flavitalea sp. BT771 TaxID=3063329 RepID=UPI0026E1357A|nr:murein L,D-transpeptidase catalytic domain family protein [Flavitalea sp. BT771]MDO6431368.1 murein L,D-transpeptidase catalytic domain family protein [Flavitalea sp. BT771]MDV6220276.1 murein L,D-transpeptidase catalytic domain family protein [Flavitalea sp. BT771]
MRILTSLLCKVTLSSMILTAPSIASSSKDDGTEKPLDKDLMQPYYSSAVIKKFVNYTSLTASPIYSEKGETTARLADVQRIHLATSVNLTRVAVAAKVHVMASAGSRMIALATAAARTKAAANAKAAELKMVINEAAFMYDYMELENSDLNEQAFEYAWRGYHNLLKKGLIRKKNVLTICDFSQPSYSKRLYVIDVRHKKLLYQTYVAHGQNSGGDYATSFSNDPESFKSSLGFYLTNRTYRGRNGLSLRISGIDTGYNDMASKRNIVLHGSNYVNPQYMSDFGTIGTSLGCPAIPTGVSKHIIRAVKNGSCLFIYHPTPKYLEESVVINNY